LNSRANLGNEIAYILQEVEYLSSRQYPVLSLPELTRLVYLPFSSKSKVVVEWFAFPLRHQEVPGSSFGPETVYSDRYFVVVISS
jgi:hypothetical protein